MKRAIILTFTFFALLFAFATSDHAQATGADCSYADQAGGPERPSLILRLEQSIGIHDCKLFL
jgi:hypothetical protein